MDKKSDNQLRGVVPLSYVALLYDYLDAQGVDAPALLAGPRPDTEADKLARFPVASWKCLLERAAKYLQNPQLGLVLGQQVDTRLFGVLGYVLMACQDLGAALERLQQYHQLVYDVNPLRVAQQGDTLVLSWGVERGRPGALVDEFAIAALVQFARDITGQRLVLTEVSFVNPRPENIEAYQDYFAAPLSFSQAETRVGFPLATLHTPLRRPDSALLELLETQLKQQLQSLEHEPEWLTELRHRIAHGCAEGGADIEQLAAELAMSGRTLRRRLAEQGFTFKSLLDDTRFALAKQYLDDPRLQLAEIALLLGYSAQSAFNRSFSRWAGKTPRQYRLTR